MKKLVYSHTDIIAHGFVDTGESFDHMVSLGCMQRLAYELDVTQGSLRTFRTNIDGDKETWRVYYTKDRQNGYVSQPILNF